MQPPEVRILKHLLTLEDPQRLADELAAAFEAGPNLATEQQDFLSTCAPATLVNMCCRMSWRRRLMPLTAKHQWKCVYSSFATCPTLNTRWDIGMMPCL